MAILQQPTTTFDLFGVDNGDLPPAGTYAATILDIMDKFGVERTKFQSVEVEKVDLTAFLFGYRGGDGKKYRISTRPMKISGHPKAALYKFLSALLGRSPAYGWDYASLKGSKCLLTIAHMSSSQGNLYAAITAAVPLPAGFGGAPDVHPVAPPPAARPPEIHTADDDTDADDEIPF